MRKLTNLVIGTLMCGWLAGTAHADGEPMPGQLIAASHAPLLADRSSLRTAEAAQIALRASEADLRHASAQLELARRASEQARAWVRIEGAADVRIGGEIRAARMVEAQRRRTVEAISADIAEIDAEIARLGAVAPKPGMLARGN